MLLLEDLMPAGASNIGYVVARYGHIVASMLLIGGLLFHEMVVPSALSDEKEETQRALFARTRWSFSRIGWASLLLILVSGVVMSSARLPSYLRQEYFGAENFSGVAGGQLPMGLRTGWWWAAHSAAGLMAMVIAIYVLSSSRPLSHPITWLRLDLIVLLVVVFLGSVTHYVDLLHLEHARPSQPRAVSPRPAAFSAPSTAPAGEPAPTPTPAPTVED